MERVKGIEPSYSAWEAGALPLCYTRMRCGKILCFPLQSRKNPLRDIEIFKKKHSAPCGYRAEAGETDELFQFSPCVFPKRDYIMNHLRANLAQSVEQLIRNEQVIGSNPMIGSIFLPQNMI